MTDADYDRELGRITPQDREYAADLIDDVADDSDDRATQIESAAAWLRKVRYEAVMADRKSHAALAAAQVVSQIKITDKQVERAKQAYDETVENHPDIDWPREAIRAALAAAQAGAPDADVIIRELVNVIEEEKLSYRAFSKVFEAIRALRGNNNARTR